MGVKVRSYVCVWVCVCSNVVVKFFKRPCVLP